MADALLFVMFPRGSKQENICCGHKNVSARNQKHFRVSDTYFVLCTQQMLRAGANRETFVAATCTMYVSATLCPRLPPP